MALAKKGDAATTRPLLTLHPRGGGTRRVVGLCVGEAGLVCGHGGDLLAHAHHHGGDHAALADGHGVRRGGGAGAFFGESAAVVHRVRSGTPQTLTPHRRFRHLPELLTRSGESDGQESDAPARALRCEFHPRMVTVVARHFLRARDACGPREPRALIVSIPGQKRSFSRPRIRHIPAYERSGEKYGRGPQRAAPRSTRFPELYVECQTHEKE